MGLGLQLMVYGLAGTFAVLVVSFGAIVLLVRLFPSEDKSPAAPPLPRSGTEQASPPPTE